MTRVLVVDDEPGIVASLRRTLRREGWDLLTAAGPEEAWQRLQTEGPVDMVISDYQMPGLTGVELLARVVQAWPDTRCVLISGWADSVDEAQLQAAGIRTMISKPWDDAELKSTLRGLLLP